MIPATRRLAALAGLAAISIAPLAACDDDGAGAVVIPAVTAEAVVDYGALVHASYQDALSTAEALDVAIDAFIADPSETTLTDAREAWLDAREPYLQTEVYRFYGGPIDDEDGPEGLLNAWPLDENHIDYTADDADAGIVNDVSVTIDAATLEAQNEVGGEKNIATGYHAIEFLLWGQDSDPDGPGDRPYTDYVTGGTASNQERRAQYLATASDLLVANLQDLVDAWAPDASNYRAELVAAEPREGLRRILTGMIILSGFETGGERLQTALDSGDQEDEHSCFSDNTHRDMVQDVRGVQNVWLGRYQTVGGATVQGVGVQAVVTARDPQLAAQITAQIAASLAAAEALEPPFDQEIALTNTAGRARVAALVTSLRAQEDLLEEAFRLFDLTIPEPE